jgi:hypothetical protein
MRICGANDISTFLPGSETIEPRSIAGSAPATPMKSFVGDSN